MIHPTVRHSAGIQSPPEESVHMEIAQVLKGQGGQNNARGSAILPMELVKCGQNPIWKVQKMVTPGAKVSDNISFEILRNPENPVLILFKLNYFYLFRVRVLTQSAKFKTSSIDIDPDTWNHLVVRFTKPYTVVANVNGVMEELYTIIHATGSYPENDGKITFGRGYDQSDRSWYYTGHLDEFRAWDYPLSDDQAYALYSFK